ncbi:hypothetical protein KF913_04795 [Candidatus Obscuribacterales bacterium]|nr:hypothetical protein [Candidatus Obscuribacterales bacterium]
MPIGQSERVKSDRVSSPRLPLFATNASFLQNHVHGDSDLSNSGLRRSAMEIETTGAIFFATLALAFWEYAGVEVISKNRNSTMAIIDFIFLTRLITPVFILSDTMF